MKPLCHLIFALILIGAVSCKDNRSVKVKATDENGKPLKDVSALVTFLGYSGKTTQRREGLTDANGVFQASGNPQLRMYARLEKWGYYITESGRLTREHDHDVSYVLREIKKPIPLFAKRLWVAPPVIGEEFGYDCELGDWVKPHGNGKIKDLVFTAIVNRETDKYTDYDHELTLGFSNKMDGFVKFKQSTTSELKAPHEAPENGRFQNSWTYFKKRAPGKGVETNSNPDEGYFFRLRSKVDDTGNLISCHYAKAHGDIPDLKIYFNPTPNDPNLEFTPMGNLFTDLESTEQVREP